MEWEETELLLFFLPNTLLLLFNATAYFFLIDICLFGLRTFIFSLLQL